MNKDRPLRSCPTALRSFIASIILFAATSHTPAQSADTPPAAPEAHSLNQQGKIVAGRRCEHFADQHDVCGYEVALDVDSAEPSTPAPVTGLRADVHSQTAAELFWDRPLKAGISFEVSRDGTVLERTTGASFLDDSLTAGYLYSYEVVTIDETTARSRPRTVWITTPGSERSTRTASRR